MVRSVLVLLGVGPGPYCPQLFDPLTSESYYPMIPPSATSCSLFSSLLIRPLITSSLGVKRVDWQHCVTYAVANIMLEGCDVQLLKTLAALIATDRPWMTSSMLIQLQCRKYRGRADHNGDRLTLNRPIPTWTWRISLASTHTLVAPEFIISGAYNGGLRRSQQRGPEATQSPWSGSQGAKHPWGWEIFKFSVHGRPIQRGKFAKF